MGSSVLLVRYREDAGYDGQLAWFVPDDLLHHAEDSGDGAARVLKEQLGVEAADLRLGFVESFTGRGGSWHIVFHHIARFEQEPAVECAPQVAVSRWFAADALPPPARWRTAGGRGEWCRGWWARPASGKAGRCGAV